MAVELNNNSVFFNYPFAQTRNCRYLVSFRNIVSDVSQRKQLADEIINCCHNKSHIVWSVKEYDYNDRFAKLQDILAYEIFLRSDKLNNVWVFIKKTLKGAEPLIWNKKYGAYDNFCNIFTLFTANRLMRKYIMNKSQLWKPYLLFLITILRHPQISCVLVYGGLFTFLLDFIGNFKNKHISYLLNHRLAEAVVTAFLNGQRRLRESEVQIARILRLLFVVIIKRSTNLQWKKFTKSVEDLLKFYFLPIQFYIFPIKFYMMQSDKTKSELELWDADGIKCGYIECAEIRRANLKVCKGCRLIYYCSRNHQKKDWKFIHSQQCLRN